MLENTLEQVEENLSGIEHLLSHSLKGFHFAFNKQDIKHALGTPLNGISEFKYENRAQVEKIFLKFVKQKTLPAKKKFLHKLTALDKELLIKVYFNILENALKKSSIKFH